MSQSDRVTASVREMARAFLHYSDLAQTQPVVVTRDGKPCNVLISVEEYERLKRRDGQAFAAADTPEEFLSEIERLAQSDA